MSERRQFDVQCQRERMDNGHFSSFFSRGDGLPSMLLWLPKAYDRFQEGQTYRVTIEPVPVNGS